MQYNNWSAYLNLCVGCNREYHNRELVLMSGEVPEFKVAWSSTDMARLLTDRSEDWVARYRLSHQLMYQLGDRRGLILEERDGQLTHGGSYMTYYTDCDREGEYLRNSVQADLLLGTNPALPGDSPVLPTWCAVLTAGAGPQNLPVSASQVQLVGRVTSATNSAEGALLTLRTEPAAGAVPRPEELAPLTIPL